MINTTRIQSGFDAELMLGKKWFLTAIQALSENGGLSLPNGITITDINIIDDPDWDFDLVTSIGFTVQATMSVVNNQFSFITSFDNTGFQIDMPNFGQLANEPTLKKVLGDADHENAMALLFNLNIRASSQNQNPLPSGEHLERGNENDAISFLPNGQHIALGISRVSFKRFANNIWHTELRDTNGSHPLPRPGDEKKGDWKKVKVSLTKKRIKFTLVGEVPIDFWPDAEVTLELELKPKLADGKLTFSVKTDLDVDTGFWGDLLAFTIGALVGLVVGIFTGGLLLIPSIGLGAVIILEVVEFVAGEVIERMLTAKDSNGNRISGLMCDNQIVQFASPKPSENGFSIGILDAIPASIPIFKDQDNPLYDKMVIIKANFDEIELNGNGLAIAGKSEASEIFTPIVASLVEGIYEHEQLKQLKYEIPPSNEEVILDIETVIDRLSRNELKAPVKILSEFDDPILQIPSGKLCCPCLVATHIRRKDTIITRIKFETGLELSTQDAISLQDKAGIYIEGLQLIHPATGKPYYRAPANETTDDNFESLPEF